MNVMIQENFPLHTITAFNIGGNARYYSEVQNTEELVQVLDFAEKKGVSIHIIGEGSNMLVSDKGVDGMVIKVGIRGIEIIDESEIGVTLQVGAAENWDELVWHCVENGWWGMENMSHIPGTVGAVPVQNVGAYGQEASETIQSVSVYDMKEQKFETLMNNDCKFRYRKSLFNTEEKERYIILTVRFALSKEAEPNITYPDLQRAFNGKEEITLLEIRNEVIKIRDSKLPLPSKIPNAGSFFKNILVDSDTYKHAYERMSEHFSDDILDKLEELKNKFTFGEKFKIPTAFIIDMCGLKGAQVGGAAINPNHALNIINEKGSATSDDVLSLAQQVRRKVYKKTGFVIEIEPELVGFSQEELNTYYSLN